MNVLPPFALPLETHLDVPSLVLIEAPGAWRFMRIPLRNGHFVPQVFRWMLRIGRGDDAHIPLPAVDSFAVYENARGDVAAALGMQTLPLEPYTVFTRGPYTFQFVPPTPDGLGIPFDYQGLASREDRLDCPSLLVKAGYAPIVNRRFPLRRDENRIGGAAGSEVPLFRSIVPTCVTLVRLGHDSFFRVDPAGSKPRVTGAKEANVLAPLGLLSFDGWEFRLLP